MSHLIGKMESNTEEIKKMNRHDMFVKMNQYIECFIDKLFCDKLDNAEDKEFEHIVCSEHIEEYFSAYVNNLSVKNAVDRKFLEADNVRSIMNFYTSALTKDGEKTLEYLTH